MEPWLQVALAVIALISLLINIGLGGWFGVLKARETNDVRHLNERVRVLEQRDINNQRTIENQSRQLQLLRLESAAMTRLLAKYEAASRESLIVTDDKGTIVEWDAAAMLMFGYNADEAVGKDVSSLIVPPELRQHHRVALANVFRHKRQPRTAPLKVRAITKTGDTFDAEVQLLPGWETGDETGSWRYGARIKRLVLPSPAAQSSDLIPKLP